MPDLTDPRKAQEALHKAVVDVAKAISDAFYKVDAELLGLPPNNPIGTELKAIRDNIFVQKQRAEKLVSGASEALQNLPPAPPELQGQDLDIQFISSLAQAQKLAGLDQTRAYVSVGIELAQGWLYGRPRPVDEVLAG